MKTLAFLNGDYFMRCFFLVVSVMVFTTMQSLSVLILSMGSAVKIMKPRLLGGVTDKERRRDSGKK
jgi:hypothetical protein